MNAGGRPNVSEAVLERKPKACIEAIDLSNIYCPTCDFAKATLDCADFENSVLQLVNFRGASLTNANFNNAEIEGARFIEADLRSAIFDRYDSESPYDKYAYIERDLAIDFLDKIAAEDRGRTYLYWHGPDFRCADLRGTNFGSRALFVVESKRHLWSVSDSGGWTSDFGGVDRAATQSTNRKRTQLHSAKSEHQVRVIRLDLGLP